MNSILMAVLLATASADGKNVPEAKEPGTIYICESTKSGPEKDVQLKNCKQQKPEPTPPPSSKPERRSPSRH